MALDTGTQRAKVFLVDDHPLVREWLGNLINQQNDLMVCGEAGGAAEALRLMAGAQPDVVIIDISLEGESGLDLIAKIKATGRKTEVIVLSMHDESLYAERAVRAGASGYIMKREVTGKVLEGIRSVLNGNVFLSQKITSQLAKRVAGGEGSSPASPGDVLSTRELEVFQLLGRGLTNRQIAEQLQLGFKTIQTYCARIKEELGLKNHTELVREAVRWTDRVNPP